jgi:hypothetical protein
MLTTPAPVRLLVIAGMLNVALSFLLGWVLALYRKKAPIERHRWLLTAHEVALQEGVLLICVAFAFIACAARGATGTLAWWSAVLLVAASVFQDSSGIVNWLQRTGDQFAEKSSGWILATVNAVLNTAGLGLAIYVVCTE